MHLKYQNNFQVELLDLRSLLLSILLIPLLWLLSGWTPDLLTVGHDAIALQAPQLQRLIQAAGDWTQTRYRLDTQGGIKVHEIYGTLPVQQLLAFFGFSVTSSINFTVFFIQVLYSFFGVKICQNLNLLWNNRVTLPITIHSLMIVIFSFTPILGWKLAYGHSSLLLGSFAYLTFFSFLTSLYTQGFTFTSLLLSSIALLHSFTSIGQQLIIYSFLFGFPLFICLFFSIPSSSKQKNVSKTIYIFALLLSGSILVSIPKLYPMIRNALSTDSSRSLYTKSMIYSYITASWLDWITSIPWTTSFLPIARSPIFHHEINYPFGPLLLFFYFLPNRQRKYLIWGSLVTILAILAFSMNWAPFSDLIVALMPLSKNFRVPERAMLIFSLMLPILTISGLWFNTAQGLKRNRESIVIYFFILLYVVVLFRVLSSTIREILLWISCLFYIGYRVRSMKTFHPILTSGIWLMITVGTFYSFQERLIRPFFSFDAYSRQLNDVGRFSINQYPELKSSLTRIHFDPQLSYFGVNFHYFMNLSSINGYWVPQKHFSELSLALMNEPYHPSINNFIFNPHNSDQKILNLLYNICCELSFSTSGPVVKKLQTTIGPAWFSQKLTSLSSLQELINEFRINQNNLPQSLKKETWVISSDPIFKKLDLPISFEETCNQSEVLHVDAPWDTQRVQLKVKTSGKLCPLSIAMNYSPILSAHAVTSEHVVKPLTPYPSYGAITGLLVPENTIKIEITATDSNTILTTFFFYLGICLWIFSAILLFKHN